MGRALTLRQDYTSDDLKRLARASRDANQTRRLLALSVNYDGSSRAAAARVGGVGRQIVRDWVERFNAEGPGGLISTCSNQNPWAHCRDPMLMIFQGQSIRRFQPTSHRPSADLTE